MKTLGIIGGIAPESTIDYYRQTIARYRERTGTSGYPSIMINSIDLKRLLELVVVGHLDELTNYLAAELGRLIAAGADFALLAANTPHIVFEQVRARCSIPLLSIVEAACEAARSMGCRRVGLLGTRFTMEAGFYPEVFAAQGIEVILPQADEREFVHSRYVGELVYTAGTISSRLESRYPPSIPIGTVDDIDIGDGELDRRIHIKPAADLKRVDKVQVLTEPHADLDAK